MTTRSTQRNTLQISTNRFAEMEDSELLAACIAGQRGAQGAFVVRFERYIRHLVNRTVRRYRAHVDGAVIDDLCQEVFIALFEEDCRRLRLFEGRNGCPLKAWIRVISMRTTISRMRRWRNHSQLPSEDSDRGSLRMVDQQPSAVQLLAAQDDQRRRDRLLSLAECLSDDDRQLIEMIYVDEMSVPDITEALSIRRGALYMRKNRAIRRLRAKAKAAGLVGS